MARCVVLVADISLKRAGPGRTLGTIVANSERMASIAEPAPRAARSAGLRYVTCTEPGILRVRRGKAFVYKLPNGKRVRQASELDRLRRLALPPAWRSVWICQDPRGHLLATGIDARGRKQYRYHPRWRMVRDEAKYDDLLAFAESLPRLRRRLSHDLARPKLDRDKVLATLVSVMAHTAVRVGSDRYTASNGSYGLTTLLDRHARIGSGKVEFRFKGKGGKPYRASVANRRLAAIVKRCRDIPGQRLFQYVDEHGDYQPITSSDVNDYLKRATGIDATAKTFRTWSATLLAASKLRALPVASNATAQKRQINAVLEAVASHLGNTRAICRKSYVDPRVIDSYLQGKLSSCSRRSTRRAGLTQEECQLVAILASARASDRSDRKAA